MPDCWLGLDLGGSHMSAVAIDVKGHILQRSGELLDRQWLHDAIIARMALLLRASIQHCQAMGYTPQSVAVGLPGVLDMANGTVLFLPNLAGQWRGVPLRDALSSALDFPVSIVNDVRSFTLAEHAYGAGRGTQHMMGLAIGTGIGGGLILNGESYLGLEGRAGEMGHQTVEPDGLPCGCGNHGCLETVASGPAIAAQAVRAVLQGFPTRMGSMVEHELNRMSPAIVAAAAAEGDEPALAILARAGSYIGIAIGNLINVLNPERVVIGGGVALAGDPLFSAIRATVKERCHIVTLEKLRIVPATLGTDAGMIGAAVWARTHPAGM